MTTTATPLPTVADAMLVTDPATVSPSAWNEAVLSRRLFDLVTRDDSNAGIDELVRERLAATPDGDERDTIVLATIARVVELLAVYDTHPHL